MSNPYKKISWIVWRNPAKKVYIKRYVHAQQLKDMQCDPNVFDFVVIDEEDKQMAFSQGYVKLTTSKRKL